MKLFAFIPARVESKRFPSKIIKPVYELPMIEHVRRRAIISNIFSKIYIVSNSKYLKKKIEKYKAKVILSKNRHTNGTSRVSEISNKFKFDYAFILFADEPFINIKMLQKCKSIIIKNKNNMVFNVVTDLKKGDLKSQQVVKTCLNNKGDIINYFRRQNDIKINNKLKKSSGILILKNKILDKYKDLKKGKNEKNEKIEQFRFLENKITIKSIYFKGIHPSVNTTKELRDLLNTVKKNKQEIKIIKKIKKIEI